MRRARSQLSKLTQQQAGNQGGFQNHHGNYAVGNEVDEIQRRLNALNNQQAAMQQQQMMPQSQNGFPPNNGYMNDVSQNFGFPQPMPSSGFQQPMPAQSAPNHMMPQQMAPQPMMPAMQENFAANPYSQPMPGMQQNLSASSFDGANAQMDNIKSTLEQMSSKLHSINQANASSGNNNQAAVLQQGEILIKHYNHINAELQGLKAAIAGVSSTDVSDSSLQVIQETLSANYRAIMQQLESSQPAQMDNSVFSAALEASHKDLSKQITDMQQSIETASNNPNVYAKTLEYSHEDISARLDDMHNALQASLKTPDVFADTMESNHRELSQQLLNLQQAFEKIETGGTDASPENLSSIEMRLEEITRAVVALSLEDGSINNLERIEARVSDMAKTLDEFSIPQAASNDQGFEKLEAKLSDISNLLHAATPNLNGVETEISKLSEKLENLSAVSMSAPIAGEENNALLKRMDELVDQMSQSQVNSENQINQGSISHQLEQISGAIDKLSMPSANIVSDGNATNDIIVQQLEQIAGAIDQLAAPSPDAVSSAQFASIEQQLTDISTQMNLSSPSGEFSFEPITSRLAGIEEQLGASRDITIELATKAAEDAVKMTAQAMPQMAVDGTPTMGGDTLNSMNELISQLSQETKANNSTNIEAFGAVTQTLDLMVHRLASIESGLSGQNFATAPVIQDVAAAPVMAEQQAFVPAQEQEEAPAMAMVSEQAAVVEEPPQVASNPAADLVKAARKAVEANVEPVQPEPQINTAFKEQIIDTVQEAQEVTVEAEKLDELPQVETPEMAMETMPEVNDDSQMAHNEPSVEAGPDTPLEPGSGGPDLAALVRQANDRRKNNKGSEADSAGTDFIAAARRAAQAAAKEAGEVEEEIEEKTKMSLFSSLPDLFKKRKKAIILAAAAALFVALAVPLASKFLGGGEQQVAAVETPAIVEQAPDEVLPQASAVAAQDTTTVDETKTENEVVALEAETTNTEIDTQEVAQQDPIATAAVNETPIPVGFELPVEFSQVTAELKAAIQNGEPAAMFELGKRYTDGVGVEKDLAKAAVWYERAAEVGFAPAQYIIGNFNEKGLGVEQNPELAAEWYQKAAKGGNIIAMHNLAVLTATPNALSAEPDMATAFKWFSNAADYGVRDSQVNAGIFHTKGFGTDVNLVEAYKWFAIAAKAGDKDAGNKRDVITNAIQPDQLEIAKSLVKDWQPLEVVTAANEVPVNEAWGSAQALAQAPFKLDRNTIAQTQALLSKVGFNAGVADGIMGQKTRNAIAAFQKQAGLPVNGQIDAEFMKALKAVAI